MRSRDVAQQTPAYARYRFTDGDPGDTERGFHRSDEEVDEAIAARMERQQVMHRPGQQFHFLLTEAVLRYQVRRTARIPAPC